MTGTWCVPFLLLAAALRAFIHNEIGATSGVLQSRQVLADIMRCGAHALKFDAVVKAGKKQTQAEKMAHQRELDGYAKSRSKTSSRGGSSSATAVGTALLAIASGGRVAKTTAALAALSVADAAANVVVYGSCPASTQLDYWFIFEVMLFGVFLGCALMLLVCWWSFGIDLKRKQRKQRDHIKTRSVKTQSQVTYKRKLDTPRFQPVGEGDQGVSLDLDYVMTDGR